MENKLPLHTRMGMYATCIILGILCILMLKSCVTAVYYGKKTSKEAADHSYEAGFTRGQKEDRAMSNQPQEILLNPLLLKNYQKGFRDGRDLKKMRINENIGGKNEKK